MNASGLLPSDWITRPAIDAELKRYVLLGYLQRVAARFDQSRLFPHLDDLVSHLEALRLLRRDLDGVRGSLQRELIGFDPRTGDPIMKAIEDDNQAMRVIDEVIAFSLPELEQMQARGNDRLEETFAFVRFEPIGLLPLEVREGWLFVREGGTVHVYAYAAPVLRATDEVDQHRSVRTRYLTSATLSLAHTCEGIKADLVRRHSELPVPATFLFESIIPLPRIETCLPLARRMVWGVIKAAA